MKLADINPNTGHPFRVTTYKTVGNWSFQDFRDDEAFMVGRMVFHHGTRMGEWYKMDGDETFSFAPTSTGWGSVSDQQGMNRILQGTGWRFLRNGGRARYEHENGRFFPN